MPLTLHPDTERLIQERMSKSGFATPDEMVRAAIEAYDQIDPDAVDDATWAAIEEAEAQYQRAEGVAAEVAFEQLRRKHFGSTC